MSWVMSWAAPDSTEPRTNTTIEIAKAPLRPYMSPSLPQTGVVTAMASR